ncbi:MAG: hypothetical protein JXA77_15300 [Bacteroidales bacterium]|nr:hypothetical protein [Bacteroidales bacterium]MBN2820234.1 hypothetical protein [Bacteroidales bacterium]
MGYNKKLTIFIKICLHIILYFIWNASVHSQSVNSSFSKVTVKDGLSHSNITYILQDKTGFMWFATYNGLNRFDGHTVKTYQHDPGDSASLSHNGSIYLFEDRDGYIWVVNSSTTGLDRYNPATDDFTRFAYDPNDSSSLSSNEIYHVMQDKMGNIWVCTINALNLVIQKKEGEKSTICFKRYYYPTNTYNVRWAYEDANGRLLLFAEHLMYFETDTYLFNKTQIKITNSRVTSLAVDKSGNIFLGTLEDGIVKIAYNKESQNYKRAPLEELSECSDRRNVLLIDEKDQIWIGTESKGLFKYKKSENLLVNYIPNAFDSESLSDNFINSLNTDRSGILWIGTGSQGICKYDLYGKEFHHIKAIPDNKNSLSDNAISGIDGNHSDELWVSTSDGVNRILFDEKGTPTYKHYYHNPNDENSIISNNTISLVQRKNGDVWVGSNVDIMSRIIPGIQGRNNDAIVKRYQVLSWTFTLFEDSEGILWGGTWGGGLWRFNDETMEFTYFNHDPENPSSICENIIWAITEDKYKNLWIGGNSKGLSILAASEKNKVNPEFINFKFEKGNPRSLSSNSIHALYEDKKGTMWIGTSGGLNKVIDNEEFLKYCQEDNKLEFLTYRTKDGLPGDGIIGIVEDSQGNIWMSTSNGISKFDFSDSTFYNYSESDGLLSDEFMHNAFFKNCEGRIFFGGPNGITAFDPNKIKPNPFIPEIIITDIKLFNQSVDIGQKINNDLILTKPVYMTPEITLSYKNNRISIDFAALHYAQPAKNQYAYCLEGFEENWNYIENEYTANYNNLNAGTYTFKVKGSNNNGIWNEKGTSLIITIKPPWWKTWMFRLLVFILIIIAIVGFIYYRLAYIRKLNITLKKLVIERTKEIELKNLELFEQTEILNETNTLLEERQQRIEEQAEELLAANNQLSDSNNKLNELNSMKDKIISIIGHDLKNPINSIMGFSAILKIKRDQLIQDKRYKFVDYIYDSANKTYQLLESLLNWARSQNKYSEFNPAELKIAPLIMNSILQIREQALKKNITVSFENSDDESIVFCDSRMVETVMRNLISNAIKFTKLNGDITISCSTKEKPGYCTIHVRDNGIGISENLIPKLFIIDKTFSTEGTHGESGTGLGLVLCKDFIEKNKGDIWLESKLGEGTRFSFTLPLFNKPENSHS